MSKYFIPHFTHMSDYIMTQYRRVGGLVLAKIPERDSLLLITYRMYKLQEKASPLLVVPY